MRTSESTAEVFQAFTDAAKELTNPAKSETVSTGKYRYTFAPLPEILDDVRGLLGKHGLAVIQEATEADGGVGITTRLIHSGGGWIEFGPLVLPANGDAQSYGSAITYGRRYAICAALGLAAEADDDAQKAKPRKTSEGGGQPPGEATTPASPKNATKGQLKAIEELVKQKGVGIGALLRSLGVAEFADLTDANARTLIIQLQSQEDSPASGREGSHAESTSSEGEVAREAASPSDDAGDRDEVWSKFIRYCGSEERAKELSAEIAGTYEPDITQLREVMAEALRTGRK